MKTKSILSVGIAVCTICFALAARADDPNQNTGSSGSSDMQQHHHHMMGSNQNAQNQNKPTDLNKASHIMGMTVQNQNGQDLGTIKDIVFNWQSGQASYAVLSKSNPAQGTSKYVAVPLSAFKPSNDQKHLVLNVDKTRVENAKGFAENNWPALGIGAYGAQPSGEEIIILEEVPASGMQHQHEGQNSKENSNMTTPNQTPNAGGPSSDTDQDNDQD